MTQSRYAWRVLVAAALFALVLAPAAAPSPVRAGTYPPINVPGPPGLPAITPEPAMRARALASTTTPYTETATYTEADVRAYLAPRLDRMFPTTDGRPAVVSRVLFIPAIVASSYLLNADLGRSPDTLVCYVEITGSLSMATFPRPPRLDPRTHRRIRSSPPKPAHLAELVFDAQTGNILTASFIEGANGGTPPTPPPAPTRTPYPRPNLPLPVGMPTWTPTPPVSPTAPS